MGTASSRPVRSPSPPAAGMTPPVRGPLPPQQPGLSSRERQELITRLQDGAVAVVLAFAAQLLIAGIQLGLDQEGSDFPAPILGMAAVFLLFSITAVAFPGLEDFYKKRLKRATELLNCHMSIGFTIPVVMLCRGPFSDARTIGMIIVGFILTGMANTILSYFLALPIQCLMVRYDLQYWLPDSTDIEKRPSQKPATKTSCDTRVSTTTAPDSGDASEADESTPPPPPLPSSPEVTPTRTSLRTTLTHFALHNPLLLLSWLITLTTTLPSRLALHLDTPLATTLLLATWLTTLSLHTALKHTHTHTTGPGPGSPAAKWMRPLLSALSNPVLLTAAVMTGYVLTDAALSHRPVGELLSTLEGHTPLSSLLLPHHHHNNNNHPPNPRDIPLAGTLAVTLLNAGLVAWGLKLFSHRAHLLSRGGLTVCSVSALLAAGNVALGPALVGGKGLLGVRPPAEALAFAARSVSVALGSPVMGILGGDEGLNAAMVVGGGIVYQMGMGVGVGGWLERGVVVGRGRWGLRTGGDGVERDGGRESETAPREGTADAPATGGRRGPNHPLTVAAGVMVGVNAAAMGTAYLYEAQSEAAPHAALSMIALGVMTVVFSSIGPLARWVVASAGG